MCMHSVFPLLYGAYGEEGVGGGLGQLGAVLWALPWLVGPGQAEGRSAAGARSAMMFRIVHVLCCAVPVPVLCRAVPCCSGSHIHFISPPPVPSPAPSCSPDGQQWLKFDDERVEKAEPEKAVQENWGGEDERPPPGGEWLGRCGWYVGGCLSQDAEGVQRGWGLAVELLAHCQSAQCHWHSICSTSALVIIYRGQEEWWGSANTIRKLNIGWRA